MRFVFGLILLVVFLVSPALLSGASAEMPVIPGPADHSVVHKVKIICGDFGEGYTCRRESGAIRRGKMRKVPGSKSNDSGGGLFGGDSEDPDALPPPSADTGTPPGTGPAPRTRTANCPANSELLGGHCIPYTQRCTTAIPPTGYPPQCQAEEKQVCNFHADGTKDCCCRTYSKF